MFSFAILFATTLSTTTLITPDMSRKECLQKPDELQYSLYTKVLLCLDSLWLGGVVERTRQERCSSLVRSAVSARSATLCWCKLWSARDFYLSSCFMSLVLLACDFCAA